MSDTIPPTAKPASAIDDDLLELDEWPEALPPGEPLRQVAPPPLPESEPSSKAAPPSAAQRPPPRVRRSEAAGTAARPSGSGAAREGEPAYATSGSKAWARLQVDAKPGSSSSERRPEAPAVRPPSSGTVSKAAPTKAAEPALRSPSSARNEGAQPRVPGLPRMPLPPRAEASHPAPPPGEDLDGQWQLDAPPRAETPAPSRAKASTPSRAEAPTPAPAETPASSRAEPPAPARAEAPASPRAETPAPTSAQTKTEGPAQAPAASASVAMSQARATTSAQKGTSATSTTQPSRQVVPEPRAPLDAVPEPASAPRAESLLPERPPEWLEPILDAGASFDDEPLDWYDAAASFDLDAEGVAHESGERRAAAATGYAKSLCTFWVGAECFGLDVALVREVLLVEDVLPVPWAPDALIGLFNSRGQVVPVISLAALLDLPPGPVLADDAERAASFAVRLEAESLVAAVVIDRPGLVVQLGHGTFTPTDAGTSDTLAVGHLRLDEREGGGVTVLDAERVVNKLVDMARYPDIRVCLERRLRHPTLPGLGKASEGRTR